LSIPGDFFVIPRDLSARETVIEGMACSDDEIPAFAGMTVLFSDYVTLTGITVFAATKNPVLRQDLLLLYVVYAITILYMLSRY